MFIDALFYILIVHFGLENYWKDEYMLNMYEQINESIIENSTLEGDSNYLDFALCYKYKYNVELKDFIIILIDGLKNEKLNEFFKLANEKIDSFGDIDNRDNIKLLVDKISKKQKKKKNIKNLKEENINSISTITEKNENSNEINSLNNNSLNKEQDDNNFKIIQNDEIINNNIKDDALDLKEFIQEKKFLNLLSMGLKTKIQ